MNNNRIGTFRNGRATRAMIRGMLLALIALAVTGMASAQRDDVDDSILNESALVKFKGGIGVIPVTGVAATGTVNLNVVRGINPAGPWRIADLAANVKSDGHIRVKGRALLLAAGDGIGTNAGASVFATLFCGLGATATAHSSTPVALEADGDFTIDGFLSPAVPGACSTPVLLIRNAAGTGVWFAAGIPKLD